MANPSLQEVDRILGKVVGADGVSPEVTVTEITGGHTVTITDADHPTGQSFNVMDGEKGDPGEQGEPGNYTKPATGIPASDLADGVLPTVMSGASDSSAGTSGLVPAPAIGDQNSFLRGDGTWNTPPVMSGASASAAGASGLVPAPASGKQTRFLRGDGTWNTPTNTKNTAGATDSSSKLFLIGATSQDDNPQTYSHDTAYVGTDGCLYSDGQKVLTSHQSLSAYRTSADQDVIDEKLEVLVVDLGTVSSLPKTSTVSNVETDMVCIKAELENPYAQKSDWTVNTNTAGKITLSGTIDGSTTVKLYLMKSR